MTLTEEQKTTAHRWLTEGMKLSDFQKRLETDFGIKLTYMEVRFLVDDLKVLPKDPEPPKKPEPAPAAAPQGEPPAALADPAGALPGGGAIKVTVDTVTRPGTMVSGRVVFSDGMGGTWYVDQYGRPGLAPDTKGYRPSAPDLQEFQMALERELVKLGL
ncbi:MAG TPA: hypothetical protein VMB21_13255 [Candidatus Limnocylindria bacterium]|jgi:hypothetical protein|nr:hypothetical protein [Candidatus Limnocylindria bacterium]